VIAVTEREFPFAFVHLAFPRGARLDPPGKEGLHYLAGQMILRGARGRSHEAFVDALEGLGASLEIHVGRDHTTLAGDTLTESSTEFYALLRDSLLAPNLEPVELDRLRRQTLAELEERRDNDEELAQHLFNQALLRPDPGARPVSGTPESLARITTADIIEVLPSIFARDGLVIGGAGDIDEALMEAELGPAVLPLRSTAVCTLPWARSLPDGLQVWLIDKPERSQTQIFAGHPAPSIHHPDYDALVVANAIFGGTFTARLSHEIREKRGWSYGAYSSYTTSKESGSFWLRYYPAKKDAVAALALGLELLETFVNEGPTDAEVAFAKSYLGNQLAFRSETPSKRLGERIQNALLGLPEDAMERHLDAVARLTREEIHRAIVEHLRPKNLVVVIVCTADELREPIEALPAVTRVTVVPYTADFLPP